MHIWLQTIFRLRNSQRQADKRGVVRFHISSYVSSGIAHDQIHTHQASSNMALRTLVALAGLVFFLIYRYIIYPAFFSPLSKIPSAHWSVSILPTWHWWQTRNSRENQSTFQAHQRHGSPLIRIAPTKLSMVSLEGLRKVYGDISYDRTEWYLLFRNYGNTPSLLSMLSGREHITRRRMLSHIYSKSYLFNSPDFQKLASVILFDRLIPVMDSAAKEKRSLDMFAMSHALAAEFLSAYQLGLAHCHDVVRDGQEEHRKTYLKNAEMKILELKGHQKARKDLEDEILEKCKEAELWSKADQKEGGDSTSPVVLNQLLTALSTSQSHSKDHEDIIRSAASEILDNLEAARVGMGNVITFVMYHLSQRPEMQAALREELRNIKTPLTSPSEDGRLSPSILRDVDGLPLLDVILTETLRLYVPAANLPRYVPKGGVTIEGYFVPAGTSIGSSAYCLHRNPTVFPDAETWSPERWMNSKRALAEQNSDLEKARDEKKEKEDDSRRWLWIFGSGGKMCIGNNLATLGKSFFCFV
jgi:hypothetical protein